MGDTGNAATNRANLQAVLDVAAGGDIIELAPGATYEGPVYLPNRGNTVPITLRTRGYGGAGWPASGRRAKPEHASLMATITPPQVTTGGMNIYPALGWRNNADNWTVQGVQFLATSNSFPSQNYQVVFIRDDTNTDVSGFPRNAVLQHCLIRGEASLRLPQRGAHHGAQRHDPGLHHRSHLESIGQRGTGHRDARRQQSPRRELLPGRGDREHHDRRQSRATAIPRSGRRTSPSGTACLRNRPGCIRKAPTGTALSTP